jgi:hypothetical protein
LNHTHKRSDGAKGERLPDDVVLMLKILILQTLYTLSDDRRNFKSATASPYMHFLGLELHHAIPDAKTIRLLSKGTNAWSRSVRCAPEVACISKGRRASHMSSASKCR